MHILKSKWFAIFFAVSTSVVTEAAVITVGQGGKYDYETIQEAVWTANHGDEIIVAPGVYSTAWNNVVVDTYGKSIWLHSSQGPSVTIIDGKNKFRGVRCQNNESEDTQISGFTIRNCNADGGGGILLDHSSPTISNCVLMNNQSRESYYHTASGGAIYCNASSAVISECSFVGNYAEYNGGAIYNKNFSSPTITNCSFEGNNSLKGGAICNSSSSDAIITDCSFQNNSASFYGGAVYLLDYCSVTMTNCSVLYNSSDISGGGAYVQGGILSVDQCVFNQNYSNNSGGAGISINNGTSVIAQSEFRDNYAPYGAGVNIEGASSVVSIGDSFFCGNFVDHVSGNWNDTGLNEFYSGCDQGACCTNDTCVPIDQKTCLYVAGEFQGLGILCEDVICPTDCLGDLNGDDIVNVTDLLEIISAWGSCP